MIWQRTLEDGFGGVMYTSIVREVLQVQVLVVQGSYEVAKADHSHWGTKFLKFFQKFRTRYFQDFAAPTQLTKEGKPFDWILVGEQSF